MVPPDVAYATVSQKTAYALPGALSPQKAPHSHVVTLKHLSLKTHNATSLFAKTFVAKDSGGPERNVTGCHTLA